MKVSPETWAARRVVLKALADQGITLAVQAQAFDVPKETVRGWRRHLSLTPGRERSPDWTPEEDMIVRTATGMTDARRQLPGRTPEAIKSRKRDLGAFWPRILTADREVQLAKVRARADREIMIPQEGEVWAELVAYGVRVSNQGRVASRRTCLVLEPYKNKVSCWFEGRRRYVTTRTLFALAFGQDAAPPLHPKYWTEAELSIIRRSRTYGEAHARLPGRSRAALIAKAHSIGAKLERSPPTRRDDPPARPHRDRLWSEANAAVPRGLPDHVRDDLIMDMIVMRLEGFEGSMAEAFKAARRAYNRMTGAFVERSAFDTIGGTELWLIDNIEAGAMAYMG